MLLLTEFGISSNNRNYDFCKFLSVYQLLGLSLVHSMMLASVSCWKGHEHHKHSDCSQHTMSCVVHQRQYQKLVRLTTPICIQAQLSTWLWESKETKSSSKCQASLSSYSVVTKCTLTKKLPKETVYCWQVHQICFFKQSDLSDATEYTLGDTAIWTFT